MFITTNGLNPHDNYICHYGVKGMKWGVRKDRSSRNTSVIANNIYETAKRKEPKITRDLTNALKKTSAKFYGLEHRLKTKESIERKINTDSKEKNISIKEASRIKDAVRYTALSKDSDFVKNYNTIKTSLQDKGYTEVRCRNYFDMYNKGLAKHKAVQSVFSDPKGYLFELQFQTPASQNAKDKKVPIYEEARNPNTSPERKKQLEKQMELLAEEVSNPVYIDKIKSHG